MYLPTTHTVKVIKYIFINMILVSKVIFLLTDVYILMYSIINYTVSADRFHV